MKRQAASHGARTPLCKHDVPGQQTGMSRDHTVSGHFERLNLLTPDDVLMIDQAAGFRLGLEQDRNQRWASGGRSSWTLVRSPILPLSPGVVRQYYIPSATEGLPTGPQSVRLSMVPHQTGMTGMADPTISSSLVDLGNISVLFRAAPNLKKLVVFNCFNLSNAVYLHSLTPLTFSKSLLGKYDLANMFRSCPAPESLSWEYIDEASQHGKDRAHEQCAGATEDAAAAEEGLPGRLATALALRPRATQMGGRPLARRDSPLGVNGSRALPGAGECHPRGRHIESIRVMGLPDERIALYAQFNLHTQTISGCSVRMVIPPAD
ncbi:hypothetical protein SCARD494_13164 [Seiridium cardinale]